jgi:hypothetical protein
MQVTKPFIKHLCCSYDSSLQSVILRIVHYVTVKPVLQENKGNVKGKGKAMGKVVPVINLSITP